MRETWLRQLSISMPEARYKFYCEASYPNGTKLLESEATEVGDMVIFEELFQQAHRQTGPKMVRSFEWMEQNLKPAHVAMVYDDTYINFNHLRVEQPTWKVRDVMLLPYCYQIPSSCTASCDVILRTHDTNSLLCCPCTFLPVMCHRCRIPALTLDFT